MTLSRSYPAERCPQLADRARPALYFLLASVASLASVGCQTVPTTLKKPAERASSTMNIGSTEPTGHKTEFHSLASAEQQYNIHMEMARVLEVQGNNEAAVAEYQKAIDVCEQKGAVLAGPKQGPVQQALAQRRMGAALDRMGRFAQADTHYQKALKLAPRDSKVWNDAGYSYYLQNRLADAERAFKTADSIEPNNPRTLTNLGLTFAAGGKTGDALAALTRAGGPAIGHANLGYILAAMGQPDQARQQYEEALTIQPELNPARLALAKLDSNTRAGTAAASAATRPPEVLLSRSVDTPARAVAPPIATAWNRSVDPMTAGNTKPPRTAPAALPTVAASNAEVTIPMPRPRNSPPSDPTISPASWGVFSAQER